MKADVGTSVTALTDRIRVMTVDQTVSMPKAVTLMRNKAKATLRWSFKREIIIFSSRHKANKQY
jgi:predicted ATP-dependent serine protease